MRFPLNSSQTKAIKPRPGAGPRRPFYHLHNLLKISELRDPHRGNTVAIPWPPARMALKTPSQHRRFPECPRQPRDNARKGMLGFHGQSTLSPRKWFWGFASVARGAQDDSKGRKPGLRETRGWSAAAFMGRRRLQGRGVLAQRGRRDSRPPR